MPSTHAQNQTQLLEAATRVRNTLSRQLNTITDVIIREPRADNPPQLTEPTFTISFEIAVSMNRGLHRDPEDIINTILDKTYLYNGVEYQLEDTTLRESLDNGPDHEISGLVTVTETPTNTP